MKEPRFEDYRKGFLNPRSAPLIMKNRRLSGLRVQNVFLQALEWGKPGINPVQLPVLQAEEKPLLVLRGKNPERDKEGNSGSEKM